MIFTTRTHEKNVRYFERYLKNPPTSDTLLFSGPSGVGKVRFALELAARLNCDDLSHSLDPKDDSYCDSCFKVFQAEGGHPDIHVLKPNEHGNYKKSDVLETLEHAHQSCVHGSYKTFILQDADLLSPTSGDAILKTIEDGYPGTIFVLCTQNESQVANTLLTRSKRFVFGKVPLDAIREDLRDDFSEDDRFEVAVRVADGSLEMARNLLSDEQTWTLRQKATTFFKNILKQGDFQLIKFFRELPTDGIGLFFEFVLSLLTDSALVANGLDNQIKNIDCKSSIENVADLVTLDSIADIQERLRSYRSVEKEGISLIDKHQILNELLQMKRVLQS